MDLVSRIQRLPIGKFHYTLLWVIGLGWMFDAMDTGLISFILAKMAEDWAMSPAEKGWVVSIGFVGMAIGAVFSGALADRFGRKTVFASTLVVYSIATAACAFAPNLTWLLALRFVLLLLGASTASPFVNFIYNISYPFAWPFFGMFGYKVEYGVSKVEISTLVAMAVYALIAGVIARLATIRQREA